MNPLILSLISLVLVGVSANLLKLIKKNKIFLLISMLPCIYIFIYGLYATFGPIDLYKDGTENFIAQNPGKDLPVVFVLLKFYQYILILVQNMIIFLCKRVCYISLFFRKKINYVII